MANADQYGSLVAAACLIVSCIMTQQFNCDRSYTWELLIICAVFASVVALSTVIDLSVIMSGTVGYVVSRRYKPTNITKRLLQVNNNSTHTYLSHLWCNVNYTKPMCICKQISTLYIMFAGALAWDILFVKFNRVCVSNTFFDGQAKYMILYLLGK